MLKAGDNPNDILRTQILFKFEFTGGKNGAVAQGTYRVALRD